MSTDAVLDPAVVAELHRAQEEYGNPEFIRQLVTLFRANTPAKMEHVRDALASRDTANIERLAHMLRTNCGMLGAMRMAGAFAQMEEAAGRHDLATAAGAMEEAERQLPMVLAALSELQTRKG